MKPIDITVTGPSGARPAGAPADPEVQRDAWLHQMERAQAALQLNLGQPQGGAAAPDRLVATGAAARSQPPKTERAHRRPRQDEPAPEPPPAPRHEPGRAGTDAAPATAPAALPVTGQAVAAAPSAPAIVHWDDRGAPAAIGASATAQVRHSAPAAALGQQGALAGRSSAPALATAAAKADQAVPIAPVAVHAATGRALMPMADDKTFPAQPGIAAADKAVPAIAAPSGAAMAARADGLGAHSTVAPHTMSAMVGAVSGVQPVLRQPMFAVAPRTPPAARPAPLVHAEIEPSRMQVLSSGEGVEVVVRDARLDPAQFAQLAARIVSQAGGGIWPVRSVLINGQAAYRAGVPDRGESWHSDAAPLAAVAEASSQEPNYAS